MGESSAGQDQPSPTLAGVLLSRNREKRPRIVRFGLRLPLQQVPEGVPGKLRGVLALGDTAVYT